MLKIFQTSKVQILICDMTEVWLEEPFINWLKILFIIYGSTHFPNFWSITNGPVRTNIHEKQKKAYEHKHASLACKIH